MTRTRPSSFRWSVPVLGMLLLCAVLSALAPQAARAQVADSLDTETPLADSTRADSSLAEASAADTLRRSYRFYPSWFEVRPGLDPSARSPFAPDASGLFRREILLDSTGTYDVRTRIANSWEDRQELTLDDFRSYRLRRSISTNWSDLLRERAIERRRETQRGGFGVNIDVPGGRNSAFTTIFGKPQVDLRVNGDAQVHAGFERRQSDNQAISREDGVQWDPSFQQDLRLGVTGSVGDKLRVNVSWDTQSQFDYQNQIKLDYQGYDDEIVQRVEAGNVFLQTDSRLIQSGQKLFGIKSQFKLGALDITTVASQEEGQVNSINVKGGAETRDKELAPQDYEANKHFFLGYYFRNIWEERLSDPTAIISRDGFEGITKISVWRTNEIRGTDERENVRYGVAMVDLGEPEELLAESKNYEQTVFPSNEPAFNATGDQYSEEELAQSIVPGDVTPKASEYLESIGLSASDFEDRLFRRLDASEFEYDPNLGIISLNQRLQQDEALAVAFEYQANGRTYQVGQFIDEVGSGSGTAKEDRIVLKLLSDPDLSPASSGLNRAAWYLEMRNVYGLGSRGIDPNNVEIAINYQPPGQAPTEELPDLPVNEDLLTLLGLDRLNANEALQPDDKIDGKPPIFYRDAGIIMFPYLEPFGNRIAEVIDGTSLSAERKAELKEEFVFGRLYETDAFTAVQERGKAVYEIPTSYTGSQPSFYDLRAFSGIIEGSVRVTAGDRELTEGVDYQVDYQSGTVTILNKSYLTQNSEIEISYEQNSIFNLQTKTLLGARAHYGWGEHLDLGATLMRLAQKSQVDKFRIGQEPIANTIWGVDGAYRSEADWLTRAIDWLPFIQTREASRLELRAEFAQLRPSTPLTEAFRSSRSTLQEEFDRDFNDDELEGLSYLDGFEEFEQSFQMTQPGAWRLASPPADLFATTAEGARRRARFGWYKIGLGTQGRFAAAPRYIYPSGISAVDEVLRREVFPSAPVADQQSKYLTPLDLYINPRGRGPYNYTDDLATFYNTPAESWAGMMTNIPAGYNQFNLKNIEFVEFIMRPFAENAENDAGPDARLIVDLGSISEDVLPDGNPNTEDGLSVTDYNNLDLTDFGRLPTSQPNDKLNLDESSLRTEDLGFDGLPSRIAYPNQDTSSSAFRYFSATRGGAVTENTFFRNFLQGLPAGSGDPLLQALVRRIQLDPSGDDFHHFNEGASFFEDDDLFPARDYGRAGRETGASMQERFSYFFSSQELNSYESQRQIAANSVQNGNSRYPDTEDIDGDYGISTANDYYQYELPLSRDSLDARAATDDPSDYVVGEIETSEGQGTGWYLVRIPVRNFTRRVGEIDGFSLIKRMRIWTTGHRVPATIRMATLDLVGSQWRKSDQIRTESDTMATGTIGETRLSIASINNEENAGTYEVPIGVVRDRTRSVTSGANLLSREQAMVLRVENMQGGQQRGVFKTYSQGLNLLKYGHLRMFSHMHARFPDGSSLTERLRNMGVPLDSVRQKLELFVRLGSNESDDYYEYAQPLTPADPSLVPEGDSLLASDYLWRTNQTVGGRRIDLNSLHIELDALNKLKVARDEAGVPLTELFPHTSATQGLVEQVDGFAPPGTVLGIKGRPSLGQINMIVIGVRMKRDEQITNPLLQGRLEQVEMWVNELRVSGYDQDASSAAIANARVDLAGLGSISADFSRQTSGFGGLSSTLGERDQRSSWQWGVNASLDVGKLLPRRYGWSVPVSLNLSNSRSLPRYAPSRGDVEVDDLLELAEGDTTLTDNERELRKDEIIDAAETRASTRSVAVQLNKNGSESPWLRKTIDNLDVSYSFSDQERSSPSQRMNDNWSWRTDVRYALQNDPYRIKPLWFLGGVPFIGPVGGLEWNVLPRSLRLTARFDRSFSTSQSRTTQLGGPTGPLPLRFRDPLRENHRFAHDRSVEWQYAPFTAVNLSYQSSVRQLLHSAGVDTVSSVAVEGEDGLLVGTFDDATIEDLLADGVIVQEDINQGRVTQIDNLDPFSLPATIRRAFNLRDGWYSDNYNQRLSLSLRPDLQDVGFLDWVSLQDITLSSAFDWRNGPLGRPVGADIGNTVQLQTGLTLNTGRLWEKLPFYRNMKEAEREAERSAATDSSRSLIDFAGIGRKIALGFFSMDRFNVTYRANSSAQATNVGREVLDAAGNVRRVETGYSLLDAILGDGPSMAYRLGLTRDIDLQERVINPYRPADALRENHTLTATTSLSPFESFNLTLNWNLGWTNTTNVNYSFEALTDAVSTTRTSAGSQQASVWSFRASYKDLFLRQLETYREDLRASQGGVELSDENGDGRTVLSDASVRNDFRRSFLFGSSSLGQYGLLPLPLPGWTINYSGFADWPLVRAITQSASLTHSYRSSYASSYRTELRRPDQPAPSKPLGIYRIVSPFAEISTSGLQVNETFAPLIGMNLSFAGGIRTQAQWNKTSAYGLSLSRELRTSETDEFSISASYRKQGLKIPFFDRINNEIKFNLSVALATNNRTNYNLGQALQQAALAEQTAAQIGSFDVDQVLTNDQLLSRSEDSQRLTVSPSISYRFSQRVRGDFTLRYERFNAEIGSRGSYSNLTGGFNIRVSISN